MTRGLAIGRTAGAAQEPVVLDADDLTTHGLIVGMTGSGKTALGIVLIEELLKNGVPVLAIDPKGDLANLLLAFPDLSPASFAPWVDTSTGATAEGEASRWSEGLASSGLSAKDVAALAASRRAVVYTPGSDAGVPLDLLGSCSRPASGDDEDARDVASAFVGGLLSLAGIDADAARSREAILLDLGVRALWERGETATLEGLLGVVARPPFATVGALPLETFYPAKDREKLMLALNTLLASPDMAPFRKGAPLDVEELLGTKGGKVPLSIVSIAHLGDAERLFVVATLLSRVKAWMRGRPGTSRLAAAVYIDEIFGFFPPSAEPPTKRPLLTLLKQARAFGVGLVLATQNPVDLDYKGLANCGCWFVGRLQTERDRARLLDGLRDAGGGNDVEALLSATKKRVFLLHDVHRSAPVLLETRWAMSYLRGPMTKEEITRANALGGSPPVAPAPRASGAAAGGDPASAGPPAVPSPWTSRWVALRDAEIAVPYLFVRYAVRYRSARAAAPEVSGVKLLPLDVATPGELFEGESRDATSAALLDAPPRVVRYEPLPDWLGPRAVAVVERTVKDRLPDRLATTLLRDPVSGAISTPGESREDFSARLATGAAAPAAMREKLEKKRRDLEAAQQSEKSRELEKWASVGGAAMDVLGGLLGKRKSLRVSKVGSVLSKQRMEGSAESKVAALEAEIQELEAKVARPDPDRFEPVEIVPARAHVDVLAIGVAWVC